MLRAATPQDAVLLAALHDRARTAWPDFSPKSPDGVASALTDDGMVYLLAGDRAAVCVYADVAHRYGFMDFPYAERQQDADLLVEGGPRRLTGLRVECPLPAERA